MRILIDKEDYENVIKFYYEYGKLIAYLNSDMNAHQKIVAFGLYKNLGELIESNYKYYFIDSISEKVKKLWEVLKEYFKSSFTIN